MFHSVHRPSFQAQHGFFCCISRRTRVCSSSSSSLEGPVWHDPPPQLWHDPPPQFDVPERQPTPAEVRSIAAGARLTPEQQLAQQLQLPLTQPVRLPPSVPEPRQLMERIKSAKTWQELEAAVYQKQELLALQQAQPQQQQQTTQQQQPSPVAPPSPPPPQQQQQTQQQAMLPEQPQPQQQQQQQGQTPPPASRKQRRKQPVPTLNVPVSANLLSASLTADQPVQQPSPSAGGVTRPSSSPTSPPVISSTPAGSSSVVKSAAAATGGGDSTSNQQQQQQQAPFLNALHVTEAFRRLPALLPQQQRQLQPAERQRVAALINHLCQAGLQHAQAVSLDPRGIAHVLSGLNKLGHRDAQLLAELQLAALLQVNDFSSRHTAMLLAAFATMRVRPEHELMSALQQHITNTLTLFDEQSLATTIWALAKLQGLTAAAAAAATTEAAAAAGPQGRVPYQLVQALMWRCDPQMHHWSGRALAQAAWGLGKLAARPNAVWRQSLLAAAAPRLSKMNLQDISNLLAALPTLRALPEQQWLDTLCSVATIKMWLATPMNVSLLLLGLQRVKQAQVKAAKSAVKWQQAQQQSQQSQQQSGLQQQQQAEGSQVEPPAEGLEIWDDMKQQQQQQEALGAQRQLPDQEQQGSEMTPVDEPQGFRTGSGSNNSSSNSEGAGSVASTSGDGVDVDAVAAHSSSSIISVSVSTLAELRLLKAVVQWLVQHPAALQRLQVGGVITALGELLPEAPPLPQQQQSPSPPPPQQQQQQQPPATGTQQPKQQERSIGGRTSSSGSKLSPAMLKVQRQVVRMLQQQLIPSWENDVDSIAKGMGSGRQARYFKLMWAQLQTKCGGGAGGGQQSSM